MDRGANASVPRRHGSSRENSNWGVSVLLSAISLLLFSHLDMAEAEEGRDFAEFLEELSNSQLPNDDEAAAAESSAISADTVFWATNADGFGTTTNLSLDAANSWRNGLRKELLLRSAKCLEGSGRRRDETELGDRAAADAGLTLRTPSLRSDEDRAQWCEGEVDAEADDGRLRQVGGPEGKATGMS